MAGHLAKRRAPKAAHAVTAAMARNAAPLLLLLHQACAAMAASQYAELGPYEFNNVRELSVRCNDDGVATTGGGVEATPRVVTGGRRRLSFLFRTPAPSPPAPTTTTRGCMPDARLYYPTLVPRSEEIISDPDGIPLVGYIHPLFGRSLEEWIEANMPMINHLTSHGMMVLVSTETRHEKLPKGEYSIDTFQDSAIHLMQAMAQIQRRNSGAISDAFLRGKISRYGVVGYSVGGAMASWLAAESRLGVAERVRRGLPAELPPMEAAVSLGPTVGRAGAPNGARERYEALRHAVPHLLVAGSADNMGGQDGIDVLYGNQNATRVYVLYDGASHCWIMYPFASECGSDPVSWYGASLQQAASREATAAFLSAFLANGTSARTLILDDGLRTASAYPIAQLKVAQEGTA